METTTEGHESQKQTHAYSGKAVIALVLGVCALVLPAPFNLVLAVAGLVSALLSRRDLQADPQLRGTVFSLLAFLISAGVLVVGAIRLF